MCHIYRYFRSNTRHFFRYPGGRGSKLRISIYTYYQPSPAGTLSPPQQTPQPWHYMVLSSTTETHEIHCIAICSQFTVIAYKLRTFSEK